MKMIIPGVVAFLVSLGGSTAFVAMRTPLKPPAAAHADSTAATPATTVAAKAAVTTTTPAKAPDTAAPATVPQATGAAAGAATGAAAGAATGAATPIPAPLPTPASALAHAATKIVTPPTSDAAPGGSADAGGSATPVPGDYKTLAHILGNMKPPQAAAIVERLSDDDVLGIVRALGPRQSAVLLAQVPPDRAAHLGRRLLVPVTVTEGGK